MTGMITLSDGGQNYIEFDINCDIIVAVRPSELMGWVGTKILNKAFLVGGQLEIDLQWKDYNFSLPYPITQIDEEKITGDEWLVENMSFEPSIYTNPRTQVDHLAYTAYCLGIPLYFDCITAPAVAAANALLNTDKIPSILLENLEGVQLVGEPAESGPYTIADIWSGILTIYSNNTVDYGIIAHEAAHMWAEDIWAQIAPPADSDYRAAINSEEPPVSEYAKKSPGEDFAEAVRWYVTDPALTKNIAPLRYEIIKRMLEDPSYYG